MEYNCTTCNYATNDKSNFQKHLSSIKHHNKSKKAPMKSSLNHKRIIDESFKNHESTIDAQNKYNCPYCENIYSTASNLARHKRTCTDKKDTETKYNSELDKKEQEIQHIKEQYEKETAHLKELHEKDIQKTQELNKKLEDDVKYLKSLINNAGAVIKTSVSALAYVAQNYDEAPVLKKLKDYSYIKEIELDEDDSDDDEFDLIEILIYQNIKETIQEYLGNIIVDAYKKKDPTKQSIWNSDTTRLTYIIRDLINKKPDWTVDKKGIKTIKYVIDPLLKYIREQVAEYVLENGAEKYINLSEFMLNKHAEKLNSCGQIMVSIDNKSLSKLVLRYIAPHFYLAKPEQLIEE